MTEPAADPPTISQSDYEILAAFRLELRRFLQFSEQEARKLGLTPQQHQTLLAIRAAPGQSMSIGQVADQLFTQPQSASELVDRLVSQDLLERDIREEDRRRVSLRLTATGERSLAIISPVHRAAVIGMRQMLISLLKQLD